MNENIDDDYLSCFIFQHIMMYTVYFFFKMLSVETNLCCQMDDIYIYTYSLLASSCKTAIKCPLKNKKKKTFFL